MIGAVYNQAGRWLRELPRLASAQTNFHYAFFFLPPARRRALQDVYAYCRLIDDIVDGPGPVDKKAAELLSWRRELNEAFHDGHPTHPVAQRLQDGQRRFGLRYEDALAVLVGCEADLRKTRYETWDEVYEYCYHVASSVGLLCIALFGCTDPRSRDYAIHLGQALQLTNILRDIAEDAARDRIYLPLQVVRELGLSEADILGGVTEPSKEPAAMRLLSTVAARARQEYRLAREARTVQDRLALLPAEIMGAIYFKLLEEIEKKGLCVLRPVERLDENGQPVRPVKLSRPQKLSAALFALAGTFLPS